MELAGPDSLGAAWFISKEVAYKRELVEAGTDFAFKGIRVGRCSQLVCQCREGSPTTAGLQDKVCALCTLRLCTPCNLQGQAHPSPKGECGVCCRSQCCSAGPCCCRCHRHRCPAAAAGTGAIPAGRCPCPSAAQGFSGGQASAGSHAAWLPWEVAAAHVSASVLKTEIDKLLKWRFSSDGSEMPFLFSWRFCKLKRES